MRVRKVCMNLFSFFFVWNSEVWWPKYNIDRNIQCLNIRFLLGYWEICNLTLSIFSSTNKYWRYFWLIFLALPSQLDLESFLSFRSMTFWTHHLAYTESEIDISSGLIISSYDSAKNWGFLRRLKKKERYINVSERQ